MTDLVVEAQAQLLQVVLHVVAEMMPAAGIEALRQDIAALRAVAARKRSPAAEAMVEACDMALADLSAGMAHQSGDDGG